MPETPDDWATVSHLCAEAMEAKLTLDRLHAQWPSTIHDPFLNGVFDDIEDAVEHVPRRLFSNELDAKRWKESRLFLNLLIDSILLKTDLPTGKLAQCRSMLLMQRGLTEETARARLNACLSEGRHDPSG